MNYTKGNWEAYFGHDGQFKGEPFITAPRENGLPHVMVARLIDGTLPELEANAHLISAAPELYEALKAYQAANRLHNDSESELFDKAEKALAKAEGVN